MLKASLVQCVGVFPREEKFGDTYRGENKIQYGAQTPNSAKHANAPRGMKAPTRDERSKSVEVMLTTNWLAIFDADFSILWPHFFKQVHPLVCKNRELHTYLTERASREVPHAI